MRLPVRLHATFAAISRKTWISLSSPPSDAPTHSVESMCATIKKNVFEELPEEWMKWCLKLNDWFWDESRDPRDMEMMPTDFQPIFQTPVALLDFLQLRAKIMLELLSCVHSECLCPKLAQMLAKEKSENNRLKGSDVVLIITQIEPTVPEDKWEQFWSSILTGLINDSGVSIEEVVRPLRGYGNPMRKAPSMVKEEDATETPVKPEDSVDSGAVAQVVTHQPLADEKRASLLSVGQMFRHNGADGLSILCRSPEAIEHLTKPEDVDMAMVNFAASVIEMKLNEFALTEQRKWQDGIFVNLSNKKPSFDMTEQLIDVKLVFGGAVSVLRTTHCYECCKVFGIPLFVDGSAVKGIHNQRFVLAWNVPEISNAQKAT